MQDLITLTLTGRIIPKARPRVTRGQAYLPSNYRDWKEKSITEIISQLPLGWRPFTQACVAIQLQGSMRGDIDNISGSILDVLVQSQVLRDDRLSCLPKLVIRHVKQGGPGAIISILGIAS